MNAQYFINKFEAIPEEKWAEHILQDKNGNRCAIGHCIGSELPEGEVGVFTSLSQHKKAMALITLFSTHLEIGVVATNDGLDKRYQQETPKQRILAALRDIQTKEQQDKAVEEAKELVATELCVEY